DQFLAEFGDLPGLRQRAAILRADLDAQLARAVPGSGEKVLYLIWREPWMTVARDTYISAMLAQVGWQTWPEALGGLTGAARYPALSGSEAWLADIDRVLLSSEPYRFDEGHIAEAQRLCPQACVQLVDGELLSWYGPRAAQGLAYLHDLASG
ncbi:MAG TPA: helical backbone metal receptor, partial [Burkholderiaceae bacterium]